MATINFNVPDAQLPRIVAAMAGIYPVPQIPDPDWVDPGDGSQAPMVDEFTPNQWAKETVRRKIVRDVRRWEHKVAADAAASGVTEDDTLLS